MVKSTERVLESTLTQDEKIKLTAQTVEHLIRKAMAARIAGDYEAYFNYRETALDLEHSLVSDCLKRFG